MKYNHNLPKPAGRDEMCFSGNRLMIISGVLLLLLVLSAPSAVLAQSGHGRIINIPDIPGYMTLKCDFHMHTVFSDGIVWPTVRVQEAFNEGLDAIAISDHDDYAPHKADVQVSFTRPYEIALSAAEAAGIILIPGIEISRHEPYGHHNAIFVTELGAFKFWENNAAAPLDTLEAYQTAAGQGAFMFWNHPWAMPPLWEPDRESEWTAAQDLIYGNGWLGGIEIVNGKTYDPIAHRFALEKKLTLMGNTDIHNLIAYEYSIFDGGHRPMTLVFARERTLEGIKDALTSRRTVVWSGDMLIGEARYLEPVFEQSVSSSTARIELAPGSRASFQVSNTSDFPLILERISGDSGLDTVIEAPKQLTVPACQSITVQVRCRGGQSATPPPGKLAYRAANFLVAPEQGLEVTLPVELVVRSAR